MTSAYSTYPQIDWLTCECSCVQEYEEDFPVALCGSWDCPGGCDVCWQIECSGLKGLVFLPLFGPLNRDGTPLGFLLVRK
jgi:hypothetical protein